MIRISFIIEPLSEGKVELLQPVDVVVGKDLHQRAACLVTALSVLDVQRLETATVCYCLTSEFKKLAVVLIGRVQLVELERFKVVSLQEELLERPVLQLVRVAEVLDGEALEAMFFNDGMHELFEYRVDDLG